LTDCECWWIIRGADWCNLVPV